MAETRGVKFYSITNSGISWQKERIEEVLKKEIKDVENINEALELCNINSFFENGISYSDWSIEENIIYQEKLKQYQGKIGKFCAQICSENIDQYLSEVTYQYVDDFWSLIKNIRYMKGLQVMCLTK